LASGREGITQDVGLPPGRSGFDDLCTDLAITQMNHQSFRRNSDEFSSIFFRALYDVYKDRVYSISLHFFHGDAAMASDVSQQVFLPGD
jgi:hypothetical protein